MLVRLSALSWRLMRVLLDNNVNYRFGQLLAGHEVTHVQDLGWERLRNGDLVREAERAGYAVLITADKNLEYQQSLVGREISIVVLNSLFIKWAHIAPLAPRVLEILSNLGMTIPRGSFINVNSFDAD